MKIDIFDVGHGACSLITAPNGRRIMIDCGYRGDEPYWWPSIHFYGQTIDALVLTNLDEDHVADFGDMRKNVSVGTILINNTIDATRLRAMKADGMGSGVTAVHEYLQGPPGFSNAMDLSPLKISAFRHTFGTFTETNNLSLIVFIEYGPFCIVYPGDLEEDGWKRMLLNADVRSLLQRVNIFVVSHHGRESGCCAEVFENSDCKPHAFVISDKEMVHDTQETTAWYRQHARGLVKILNSPWETPETRFVFTTRKDRCMTIDVELNGNFILHPNSDRQDRKKPLDGLTERLVRRP